MKRVIIIGCAGSGKSTFARALQGITSLPLIHLDLLYWKEDGTTITREELRERLGCIMKEERWIIDGNYAATMEERMEKCDTVFFLDYPTDVCLGGILERRGKPRSDMPCTPPTDDHDFIEFIKNYRDKNRPAVLELLKKYDSKSIYIFKSRSEADEFLESIKAPNS